MKDSFPEYSSQLHTCFLTTEANREDLAKPILLEEAFHQAYDLILKTNQVSGKVIFIGNGGSAAIASHQAVDLWKNGGIRAVAFNDPSLLTCVSNDYGYESVFEKPIDMFAEKRDTLIAISSSGQSPNILRAVDRAQGKGCSVITLSGFRPDNPLRRKGRLNFYVSSQSYGVVEIAHLAICHYLADQVMSRKTPITPPQPAAHRS